jgi:peptide/nickel transport system substrate-binding protein
LALCPALFGQGELRFCTRADPRTFHPLLADEDASQMVLYMTSGSLIRINRLTQKAEPAIAESWKIAADSKSITFHLRKGVQFSDGTPLLPDDVGYTIKTATDPGLHSPVGESFAGNVKVTSPAADTVMVAFPDPHGNFETLFDSLPILSSKSPLKEKAGLGPFMVASHQPGVEVLLKRNPHYWKRDGAGRQLPYLEAVRILVQQNPEIQYARFRRGEIHLLSRMDPAIFERLQKESPSEAKNAGPSMDVDFFWFNQVAGAEITAYKKEWFRGRNFRLAVSQAINRDDICRIVYHGFARPVLGPFPVANAVWFDSKLKPQVYDSAASLALLKTEGFQLKGGQLFDKSGNQVEFSIITNTGNKAREGMAVLIQQDLKKIGIHVNITTLDFLSIGQRIKRNFQYEAALLGLTNVDLDPTGQMNVWLSSAEDHGWNPRQKTPETPWEAEIDRLMLAQASSADMKKRKEAFDRVQEIVREQLPYIYLVSKDSILAVSNSLKGVTPARLFPETIWNIDQISFK